MATKRFVDANVLLRYILKDNEALYGPARADVEDSADNTLILTAVILAEIIYILLQHDYSRQQIAATLQLLCGLPSIEVEDAEAVSAAMQLYAARGLDFADCYILERSVSRGLGLASQDKKLLKELLRMSGLSSRVTLEAKQGKIIISKPANPRAGWSVRIKALVAIGGDPAQEFDDMTVADRDGLEDLPWDGPSYEQWLKSNAKLP